MQSKVASFAATPDPTFGQPQADARATPLAPAADKPSTPDPSDLRLVIEEDQASGSYVYKTIDRRTGEVVSELPRAEVLRMRDTSRYAAGAVIRTTA